MLLTLTATCLKPMLSHNGKGKKGKLDLVDVPHFTRETLGLTGLNLSTDLLVGADRKRLESIRERADKASCACLLLIESENQAFGAADEAIGKAAQARMIRVVEAAQIIGCSAASLRVESDDNEAALARVAARLKPVVERAEKLDVNLLISPNKGLTSTAERLAELIKKVGGFRIGTFPDFQAASAQKDATAYLRRLTPYATVVSASTVKFAETPQEATAENPLPKPRPPMTKKPVAKLAPPTPAGKGNAAKPAELEDDEDDDDAELTDEELEAALGLLSEEEPAEEEYKPQYPEHTAYKLKTLVAAVASVGYDGTLAVDYRGPGDPTMGIVYSRDALQDALNEVANED